MIDGNCVQFNFPADAFSDCEHFQCRNCKFVHVHGQKEKQCKKCGAVEFDGINYDNDVWTDIPKVRKRLTLSDN